jgi:hypothetical protein
MSSSRGYCLRRGNNLNTPDTYCFPEKQNFNQELLIQHIKSIGHPVKDRREMPSALRVHQREISEL